MIEPPTLRLRGESVGDHCAVDTVLRAAFGQPDEAELVRSLRADPAWVEQLCLVATNKGDVIGHIAFSELGGDGAAAVALAPLSVRPDHQRAGIGAALVSLGIRKARALGYSTIVVLGNPDYYGRFGFERASTLGITGPFGDIEEFQAIRLTAGEPVRSQVTYANAFGIN